MASCEERARAAEGFRVLAEFGIRADAEDVGAVIGVSYMDSRAFWSRLADLVRPAPGRPEAAPRCDRDALLALAGEVEAAQAYCVDDAVAIDREALAGWADAIQKACGEEGR